MNAIRSGVGVLIANIPTLIVTAMAGVLVERGHPWFGGIFLILAYLLAHELRMNGDKS